MEEERQREETEKRRCLTWLVGELKDRQKFNVWRYVYQAYYPYRKNQEGQDVSVQTMTSNELRQVMKDFQNRFSRASDQEKNKHYHFARAYKVYDDIYHDYSKKKNDNNNDDDMFEEEEEEGKAPAGQPIDRMNTDDLTISEAELQRRNQTPYTPSTPLFYKHNPDE